MTSIKNEDMKFSESMLFILTKIFCLYSLVNLSLEDVKRVNVDKIIQELNKI